MKTTKTNFIAALVFTTLFCSQALADEFEPRWYGNIHLANADTSLNQAEQEYSYLNIGGAFGYRFNEIIGAELFMSFATNGERDEIVSALLGQKVETEFDAVGFYVTAQSPGDYYVKGRAGFAESRFIYSSSGYEDEAGKDTGFSYGVGAGGRFGKAIVELEYVVMPEVADPLFFDTSYDTNMFLISVGADFQ